MAGKQIYKYVLALFFLLLIVGCKSTRWVKDGEYLLIENEIYVNNKKIKSAELQNILKQKPNKQFTRFFRPYLSLYNLGNPNKKGVSKWFTKIGEAPVISDSTSTLSSSRQLGLYFFSKGYFNNVTSVSSTRITEKKKIKMRYDIYTGNRYKFGSLQRLIASQSIEDLLQTDTLSKPIIVKGEYYDADLLDEERTRLVQLFRENGFYGFQKELIRFEADTAVGERHVDLVMVIADQPVYYKDSVYYRPHVPFKLGEVYIDPYYTYTDDQKAKDTLLVGEYTVIDSEENKFKPRVMTESVHFKPGDTYNETVVRESYRHLTSLRIFRTSEISFDRDLEKPDHLKAIIRLTPFPKRSVKLDLEGTNTAGNYGIFGTVSVMNRNMFKNGEIFDITLRGGFESQQSLYNQNEPIFNTYEYGIEFGVNFPRFVMPRKLKRRFPKRIIPKTRLSTSFGRQHRQEFTRDYINVGLGYFWTPSKVVNMALQLIDFSFLDLKDVNQDYLNSLDFTQGYQDVLISAIRYSYTFNNQKINKDKNSSFFISSIETSGNILNLIDQLKPDDLPDEHANRKGHYFGVEYAQYFKIDLDYRNYTPLKNENQSFVWRALAGYTFTYGNTQGLPPFEKSYFAGGSNDNRGFLAYRLGPGNYPKDFYNTSIGDTVVNYSAVGPIKLLMNLEYRFTILQALKGALFWDMGNIWLYDRTTEPTGNPGVDDNIDKLKFRWENLSQQIAMSAGMGLRYDFGFFVFRLDAGIPIFDPGLEEGKRFTPQNPARFGLKDFVLNFAIGYPF